MTIPSDQIDATLDLLRAAMESKEHVFVEWSPHVERVYVRAYPASSDYSMEAERTELIDWDVRLGSEAEHFGDAPIPALRELTQRVRGL